MATPTNLPAAAVAGDILTASYVNNLRGAFRVLQVVTATTSTSVNQSTSTFADTGLTATITPQSATSKVLVLVSQNGCLKQNDTSVSLRLMSTATNISDFAVSLGKTNTALLLVSAASISFMDSPATTSATTYKTMYASQNNIADVYCQFGAVMSSIVLVEISA